MLTRVRFRRLSALEIERYVATGEPMDKAGAYAIQGKGREFIEGYQGDYFNVIGLPLRMLAAMLTTAKLKISVDLEKIYPSQ